MSGNVTYLDGHSPAPDIGQVSYWGANFPEPTFNPAYVSGVGPDGAELALDLQAGTRVTLTWETSIIKAQDGTENQRESLFDLPRSSYAGVAWLLGDQARARRGLLAAASSQGAVFLLGLTYEGATLVADSSGTVVFVENVQYLDWCLFGGRVFVVDNEEPPNIVKAVIQDFSSTSMTLDVDVSAIGKAGCTIMPAVAVLLDPSQGFSRYAPDTAVEQWNMAAVGLTFGFRQIGKYAFSNLLAYTSGAFAGATAISNYIGSFGNGFQLSLVSDPFAPPTGDITTSGQSITFTFRPGTTEVGDAISALDPWFGFSGSFAGYATPLASGDAFGPATFAGGLDAIFGDFGKGVAVTLWDTRPVWDRGIFLEHGSPVGDQMQALGELIVDLGPNAAAAAPAPTPDWGRGVFIERGDIIEWQWLKAFLARVNGQQGSFWLSTRRNDLTFVSLLAGTLVVEGSFGADVDGFLTWWPQYRTDLELQFADGTSTPLYIAISAAVDNMDGTLSLSVTTSLPGYNVGGHFPELLAADVKILSWLEPVRFEGDEFEVEWGGGGHGGFMFSMKKQARAVRQKSPPPFDPFNPPVLVEP